MHVKNRRRAGIVIRTTSLLLRPQRWRVDRLESLSRSAWEGDLLRQHHIAVAAITSNGQKCNRGLYAYMGEKRAQLTRQTLS